MFNLPAIQTAIQNQGLDGWLLYDFRGLNIPARGEPRKLVHRIEPHALDALPGPHQTSMRPVPTLAK